MVSVNDTLSREDSRLVAEFTARINVSRISGPNSQTSPKTLERL